MNPLGPDLSAGIPGEGLPVGAKLLGHVGENAVLLVRSANGVFAVDATCTHYGGPLADGLVVGDTIRCPWHHAAFDLHTGEPLRPPALRALGCWNVEERAGTIRVTGKVLGTALTHRHGAPAAVRVAERTHCPISVVILGGGAAGAMAAETLRAEAYLGPITIIEAGDAAPYDRPNVSKDYLAGTAPEEWMPLRPESHYAEQGIALRLGRWATALDTANRTLTLDDGSTLNFGALIIATGAEPTRLPTPDPFGRLRYLRSLADSRSLIVAADAAPHRRAVVIGSSFIGLEVAASLRVRGLAVTVVAPEQVPFERVLGPELGAFIRTLHEEHGVEFRLGTTVVRIDEHTLTLADGTTLEADLVVAGVGVRPRVELAERAGLAVERGVLVDEYLETAVPGIFVAGDAARWRDPRRAEHVRVEHWVVAERQGQTAARNVLGRRTPFDAIPFFWSQHYDVTIAYVGFAPKWDDARVQGRIVDRDCTVTYREAGRVRAVASIFRDTESLEAELAFEREAALKS